MDQGLRNWVLGQAALLIESKETICTRRSIEHLHEAPPPKYAGRTMKYSMGCCISSSIQLSSSLITNTRHYSCPRDRSLVPSFPFSSFIYLFLFLFLLISRYLPALRMLLLFSFPGFLLRFGFPCFVCGPLASFEMKMYLYGSVK